MALNQLVDSRDVRFVLFEMLEAEKLLKYDKFSHLDRDTMDETINLAERIAVDYFYPSNAEGDKQGGCTYDPAAKTVTVPDGVKAAFKAYVDAGFLSLRVDQAMGGMGMPDVIASACSEYFEAGNTAAHMYAGLALGAAYLISLYGTEDQIQTYCPNMIGGKWGGSMCLTEPDAGSDVGALKAKAIRQPDGTYLISGQKIFISAGEQDMVGNIIHTVLARIEGDPAGTKGISIFIVPKFMVNKDGSLGARNDVVCTGIEHKMGIKSSATAALSFGDNGKCVGYLLGKERQGMQVMFNLMNAARIETGIQSMAQSSAAYMHAITYAKTRVQGQHFTQMLNPDAPKVSIIEHPDVKRMLLWMKGYVEAFRMLVYFNAYCMDMKHVASKEEMGKADGLVELLTPLVKAGISDGSWLVTAEAIQVYGGYGFCSDYPVEQYARDTKIFSIYEGANGIQSLDLMFRKILMNPNQENYHAWRTLTKETIARAKNIVEDKYIQKVENGLKKLDEIINLFLEYNKTGKFMLLAIQATPFQKAMFMVVLAWLHLWSLTISIPKMKAIIGDAKGPDRQKLVDENREAAYYTGRVLSAQFYIGSEFSKYFGMADSIIEGESAVVKASTSIYTGALAE
jgi:alkylation response protein AidB-like acyl-CoA dehydrogenase